MPESPECMQHTGRIPRTHLFLVMCWHEGQDLALRYDVVKPELPHTSTGSLPVLLKATRLSMGP